MRASAWSLSLLLLLCSTAQAEPKKSTGAPKVQKFVDVERGLFLRADMGFALSVTNPFGGDGKTGIWPPGPLLQLELGYDFGQIASIHLVLHGQQVGGTRDLGSRGSVSNDAAMLALMLGGRFNFMTGKRLAWFLKANVGWMFTTPALAQFDSGLLVQAGTGIEYATQLRHFFVGLEVAGAYDIQNGGVFVALTPTVKYTF